MVRIEGIIRIVRRIAPNDVRVRRRLAVLLFLRSLDRDILVLDAPRVWPSGHACDAEFREEDHERDRNGRFASGNGPSRKTSGIVVRTPLPSAEADVDLYRSLLKEYGDDFKAASKEYFRKMLQNHYVSRFIDGRMLDMHFTGGSWAELRRDMGIDSLKASMIPWMPEILLKGCHAISEQHHRHLYVVAMHSFKYEVNGIPVIVDVKEMEAADPNCTVYSLVHGKSSRYTIRTAYDEKTNRSVNVSSGQNQIMHDAPDAKNILHLSLEVVNLRIAGQ